MKTRLTNRRNKCIEQKNISDLINLKSYPVSTMMDLLLIDRTTGQNLIFATEEYTGFSFETPITNEILMEINIKPRVLKRIEEQQHRTRKKAEVFTPSWICNKMNNLCDAEWFRYKDVFNIEQEHSWSSTKSPIEFPEEKSWKDYVNSNRLEITCGEAPYLVSRYDTTTGEMIPIRERVGILDRKLRVINENVKEHNMWIEWVYKAFQSTYGYEYQGDNLLIARINLLETFCEYSYNRWNSNPTDTELKRVAEIISWNIWQMDGLQGTTPRSNDKATKNSVTGIDCKIYDWKENKELTYKSLLAEPVWNR